MGAMDISCGAAAAGTAAMARRACGVVRATRTAETWRSAKRGAALHIGACRRRHRRCAWARRLSRWGVLESRTRAPLRAAHLLASTHSRSQFMQFRSAAFTPLARASAPAQPLSRSAVTMEASKEALPAPQKQSWCDPGTRTGLSRRPPRSASIFWPPAACANPLRVPAAATHSRRALAQLRRSACPACQQLPHIPQHRPTPSTPCICRWSQLRSFRWNAASADVARTAERQVFRHTGCDLRRPTHPSPQQ